MVLPSGPRPVGGLLSSSPAKPASVFGQSHLPSSPGKHRPARFHTGFAQSPRNLLHSQCSQIAPVSGQGIPGNFNAHLSSDEQFPQSVQLQAESASVMCRFFPVGESPWQSFCGCRNLTACEKSRVNLTGHDPSSVCSQFTGFRPSQKSRAGSSHNQQTLVIRLLNGAPQQNRSRGKKGPPHSSGQAQCGRKVFGLHATFHYRTGIPG